MYSPRPQLTTPNDFQSFWRETIDELDATTPDLETEAFRSRPYSQLRGQTLQFSSLGQARLSGYALGWSDDWPRPLVIHAHGYGGRAMVRWLWALAGLQVVGFDVRRFGQSFGAAQERSGWGYMLTGIEAPQTCVLRGAACDYMRAYHVGAELFRGWVSATVFHGFSFSGALALMSEAVTQSANLLAAGIPTFGWHEGRLRFVENGTAAEIRRYLNAHPSERECVMDTLSYFDSTNIAPLIECPTVAGYGRRDDVVPPQTILATTNHLHCRREVLEPPVSHTDEPAEAAWEQFDAEWMAMALRGVPASFGTSTAVRVIPYR